MTNIVGVLRRKIAENMQEAKRRIPHFNLVEEYDVTDLEDTRAMMNRDRGQNPKLTLLPFLTGMSGPIYLGVVLVLDAMFLYYAFAMKISARPELPMKVFKFSVRSLMWLFAALLVDHSLPIA